MDLSSEHFDRVLSQVLGLQSTLHQVGGTKELTGTAASHRQISVAQQQPSTKFAASDQSPKTADRHPKVSPGLEEGGTTTGSPTKV